MKTNLKRRNGESQQQVLTVFFECYIQQKYIDTKICLYLDFLKSLAVQKFYLLRIFIGKRGNNYMYNKGA